MSYLSHKNVLVTGAGSGLGAAVTRAAAAAGANVWGLDINTQAESEITNSGAKFVHCDVTSENSWQSIAEQVSSTTGHIDHLHLNAGIQAAPPEAPLEDYEFGNMNVQRYRQMMGVNVDGVVLGLHYLLPLMKPGGSIVVTGSLAGIVAYDVDPLYSMSKHAVTGLVRSLAKEMAALDLTINALCPGGIDTNIIPNAQRVEQAIFMTPDHVANEVLMLFETEENGKTWAKVAQQKPAYIYESTRKRD